MKLTRRQLRRIIFEEAEKSEKLKVPSHFGGGKNISVFGFRTKHFDICLSAVNLFEDLKKQLKDIKFEGIREAVVKGLKISDKIFGLEKRVVKKGRATKKECEAAETLNEELKECLRQIYGGEVTKKLSYMSMHIREITKRKEK